MAATEGQSGSKRKQTGGRRLRWLGLLLLLAAGGGAAFLLLVREPDPATWQSNVTFYLRNDSAAELAVDQFVFGGQPKPVTGKPDGVAILSARGGDRNHLTVPFLRVPPKPTAWSLRVRRSPDGAPIQVLGVAEPQAGWNCNIEILVRDAEMRSSGCRSGGPIEAPYGPG
jgi:hypothetical protein